jgi:hypothetical protein
MSSLPFRHHLIPLLGKLSLLPTHPTSAILISSLVSYLLSLLLLNYSILIALDDYLSVFPEHEVQRLVHFTEYTSGKRLSCDFSEPNEAGL